MVGVTLRLLMLVEKLVEPPVQVDGRGVCPNHPRAERAAMADVLEPRLDALYSRQVVDRCTCLLVAHDHERGRSLIGVVALVVSVTLTSMVACDGGHNLHTGGKLAP
jgi:hypothetical protein